MNNKNEEINSPSAIDYPFIPVPKELYYNPSFSSLPNDAKHLFILIIDRLRLSEKNIEKFSDSNGKAFVYLTLEEVMQKLNVSESFAIKLFDSLVKAQLVTKKRQGLCKPNIIQLGDAGMELIKNTLRNINEASFGTVCETVPEPLQNKANKNNMNNSEFNNNNSTSYEDAIEEIKEQIEFESINGDPEIVQEIIMIMYDVIYGSATTVRIGANIFPKSAVVARFKKLEAEHIENVIIALETTTSKIINVKSFLITALYNAPTTAASSVAADFAYNYKHLKGFS